MKIPLSLLSLPVLFYSLVLSMLPVQADHHAKGSAPLLQTGDRVASGADEEMVVSAVDTSGVLFDSPIRSERAGGSSGGCGSITIPCFSHDGSDKGSHSLIPFVQARVLSPYLPESMPA